MHHLSSSVSAYEIYFWWCSFWVALICIINSVLIGSLSHVFRFGAADAEQNLKKAIALKDIHTLEVAPCRSRGWLNRYKAPKQTVQVIFFFSEMIRVPQWVGIRPFIIAVGLLTKKKHWRIRMIFLITFSRNHFVKTAWSMRRLDRFAKGYVWTCSYASLCGGFFPNNLVFASILLQVPPQTT